MSKIGTWTTSAAANNSAPPDGWPEGMARSSVNDAAREMMAQVKTYCNDAEWFDRAFTPTFVNANSFTVPGDQTSVLVAGRALKLYDATTIYRHIGSASYTVATTVSLDSGVAITSSLTSFAVAALAPANQSKPRVPITHIKIGVPQSASNNTVVVYQGTGTAIASNAYSFYNRTTGGFSPQGWAGWYQFHAYAELTGAFSATGAARLNVNYSATADVAIATDRQIYGANNDVGVGLKASGVGYMNGSSDVVYVTYQTTGGVQTLASNSYLTVVYLGK